MHLVAVAIFAAVFATTVGIGGCIDDIGVPRGDAGPDDGLDGSLSDACTEAACADAGGGLDASLCTIDCGDAGPPPPPEGPARYPTDRTLSPLTPFVAERLRAAHGAGLAEDLFAKVGDSITVSSSFLHCFAGANVDLGGRDELDLLAELPHGGRLAG